ncbi:MAG: NAD(P)-dependent oxidoreductase [Thermoflexus hugenholtzii]|jgi:3-hydroxyisobutyrate dehydrogenase-like beta-hydroxyacid dehydrogenase|uniref:NAD(P)-dependent oxidoreductase n=2 Tax=Thermoflexaceae TaxID=1495648 RepID=UPI001C74BAD8|nr:MULTISPECIES: NAD(P)-dependent oxidoreductase [Thermoflexus]QWK10259.1 MAG: NAD(P)-dependent oxidoreductase [Thermoflexus hugenholtzii]
MRSLGFIGLGRMGTPMARRLLQAGHRLTVHNRTRSKAEALVAEGAQWADSPRAVAQASEVVFMMLADSQASEAVLTGPEGVLAGAREGLIVVDMSTIAPAVSRRLAEQAARQGVTMLDAPVSGSVGPATEGTLTIFVGGPREAFEAVRDLLGILGRDIHYVGENGMGCAVKLAVNLILGVSIQALGEAFALGARAGIPPARLWEILSDLAVISPSLRNKGGKIVQGDFAPSFALRLMEKDLGLIVEFGRQVGASTPLAAVAQQTFLAAREHGWAEADYSAIAAWLLDQRPLNAG